MNSRIEVQPDRTIIILGPMITASLQNGDEKCSLLSLETLKNKLMKVYARYDDDLSGNGAIHSWLQETFAIDKKKLRKPPIVERLLDLQRNGALLAYLYPDNIIDQALDQEALTASDVQKWIADENVHSRKIMHVFGVYTDVESLRCWQKEGPFVPDTLANAFRNKVCICVGFSEENVQHDLEYFLSRVSIDTMLRPLLTCSKPVECTRCLCIPGSSLPEAVCSIGDTSKAIGLLLINLVSHQ